MTTTTAEPDTAPVSPPVDVHAQILELEKQLNAGFVERSEIIQMLLLALLSKEHAFVVGLPGTGKSAIVRALFGAIVNSTYFECAMSKTRSADAVLGPLDVMEFRTSGHMWRKRAGFLTAVNFSMIDEIGKMSPIIGHDMLAALNERVRHEVNGQLSVHPIPLYTAIAASNEMLTDESDDAAALWDRLLFRWVVEEIKSGKAFSQMLTGGNPADYVTIKIDFADLQRVIDTEVPAVTIGQDVVKSVLTLRKKLGEKSIHISGRRWRQSMKALQAAAWLAGRTEVWEEDLSALRFTLWETIPQIEEIAKLTSSASNPFVAPMLAAKDQLAEIVKGMDERKDKSTADKSDYAKDVNPKLAQVRADLDALLDTAAGRTIPRFAEVAKLHQDTLLRMYVDCFGLDTAAASTVVAGKLGKGDGTTGVQLP